jgi:hypothetical protein
MVSLAMYFNHCVTKKYVPAHFIFIAFSSDQKGFTVFIGLKTSVAELHHFDAASAPGKNFDAAPATPAPAPTLLYSKSI